MFVPEL
ncbi:Protein of unknown function [Propionibacterium freudenreichii subsp. freudenreichii]|nr:Protein of unknown function [Propionibacterium freudenreichii subsp. freudenreichii]